MKHFEFILVALVITVFCLGITALFVAFTVSVHGNVYACSLLVTVWVIIGLGVNLGLVADKYTTTYKG